mmetsp:Transcript_526/g.1844  ORF Transcript_526/g.1844 Transcript_526/m.1844 type:complete len:320 (+) Transcript_526:385-1344(+)
MHVKERQGGSALLLRHGSVFAALQAAYPELELFEHECRPMVSAAYWEKAEHRRRFMDGVRAQLGVREAADWRKLTVVRLRELGGSSLLWRYNGSVAALLRDVYPGEAGDERRARRHLSRAYWDDVERQLAFLEEVAKDFAVTRPEHWRRVTRKAIVALGGGGLLSRYATAADALRALGKEARERGRGGAVAMCGVGAESVASWRPTVPPEHWRSPENLRRFFADAAPALGVRKAEDWTRVSVAQVKSVPGGAGMLRSSSLGAALALAFPGVSLARGHKVGAAQRLLRSRLEALFHASGPARPGRGPLVGGSAVVADAPV